MIAIVDYGMGNVRSVLNAFELIGAPAQLVADPDRLLGADRIVIPGVGAFGDAMRALHELDLPDTLGELAAAGRPILGICLGMQLLATRSLEHGEHLGLNLIPGTVCRLEVRDGLRVPHVGWNDVRVLRPDAPLDRYGDHTPACYFVHSYEFVPDDPAAVTAVTDYGRDVTACVGAGSVVGTQFHPEKSARDGIALLRSFAEV